MKGLDLMMTFATLLRLVPYACAIVIAWRKRHYWFSLAILLTTLVIFLKLMGSNGILTQIILPSFFAFCVMIHVFQLNHRGK